MTEHIAIVSMACRWPGGVESPSQLWDLLCTKRSACSDFPKSRLNAEGFYHPDQHRPGSFFTKGGFFLEDDPRRFDHKLFGISPLEARTMDPAQRKLLEVTFEAFQNAGAPLERVSGSRTGVYVGNFNADHQAMQFRDPDHPLPHVTTGGGVTILSNRISYAFDLKGPSLTIDTACSSAMYALHMAVSAIRARECEAAVVAGSNLILDPVAQIFTTKLGAISPTSMCHTFDAAADGYARADGFGALYIMSLEKAMEGRYPIRAVIRGTAINANGRGNGITHPSVEGQESVIRQAYCMAGNLDPADTAYFECHGTGTPVGDPIEVSAIGRVFSEHHLDSPLLIGSIKPNLGHSESASAIASIMKAVLSIEHGEIAPTIGISNFNPNIDFLGARVKVVTDMTPWPYKVLRRVSVNSFGYGGANAHLILDHAHHVLSGYCAPLKTISAATNETLEAPRYLLPFSAHDPKSLKHNIQNILSARSTMKLGDLAHTLAACRTLYPYRAFAVVPSDTTCPGSNGDSFVSGGQGVSQRKRLCFVFTGQGAQWAGMGAGLYLRYPVFAKVIDTQDAILGKLSNGPTWRIASVLQGTGNLSIQDPEISQTVCTALQIGLVGLLKSWNITPTAVVGHSSGEIAAVYAAGGITVTEAILAAYFRGCAVAQSKRHGKMIAVGLGVQRLVPYLKDKELRVRVAAINSADNVTLSGDSEAIDDLSQRFQEESIFCRQLQTGGLAYHSHHMTDIGSLYERLLGDGLNDLKHLIQFDTPAEPCALWSSSVWPCKRSSEIRMNARYWRSNLESPVRFSEAMQNLFQHETSMPVCVEIGPHPALRAILNQILDSQDMQSLGEPVVLQTLRRGSDCVASVLELAGHLFLQRYPVDISEVNQTTGETQVCQDLPNYAYHYGEILYHENRVNKEWRMRKHLRHDLLGARRAGDSGLCPSWRNVVVLKNVPWLKDHKLGSHVIFPAAGYIAMAIEAMRQRHLETSPETPIASYSLRNVAINSTLDISDDEIGTEIILDMKSDSLTISTLSRWYRFKITSSRESGGWTENCSGLVCVNYPGWTPVSFNAQEPDESTEMHEKEWYSKFSQLGLVYGPNFQGISLLRVSMLKKHAKASIHLAGTAGTMIGESEYAIHPTALDSCLQLALIASHGGDVATIRTAYVPTMLSELTVWSSLGETRAYARADGHLFAPRGLSASVTLETDAGTPVLRLASLQCLAQSLPPGAGAPSQPTSNSPFSRLVWKPDIDALRNSDAQEFFPPPGNAQRAKVGFEGLARLSAFVMVDFATKYPRSQVAGISGQSHIGEACFGGQRGGQRAAHPLLAPTSRLTKPNHECLDIIAARNSGNTAITRSHPHQRFLDWVHRWYDQQASCTPHGREALLSSPQDRLTAITGLFSELGDIVETKIIKCVYESIPAIISGEQDGLKLLLKDGLLNDLYTTGLGTSCSYPQLQNVVDLFAHKNPRSRIIEIGAGTGGATRHLMETLLGATPHKRYNSYTFTDITSAFFSSAQQEFVSCRGMEYRTLDIEADLLAQDFFAHFDLAIASQVLHATTDISRTLRNLRKLLRAGSKVVLVELTRAHLATGLVLGTLPDYWKGDADGRSDGPLLDQFRWDQELTRNGFSGIDIELHDYPCGLESASVIVTTAVEQVDTASTVSRNNESVFVLSQNPASSVATEVVSRMSERGLLAQPLHIDNVSEIPHGSRVISLIDINGEPRVCQDEELFNALKQLLHKNPRLLWVSSSRAGTSTKQALGMMPGLLSTVAHEMPNARIAQLVLGTALSPIKETSEIIVRQEIASHCGAQPSDFEPVCVIRNAVPYISRIEPDLALNEVFRAQGGLENISRKVPVSLAPPFQLGFGQPGLLSSMYFEEDCSVAQDLGEEEVEILVEAAGLNTKDLAVATGKFNWAYYSTECCGLVRRLGSNVSHLKIGDRVAGAIPGNFGNFVRCPASMVQKFDQRYGPGELASVPVSFMTAIYSLTYLANLQRGESLLITSAAGALGLAAIQIASHIGAHIYATVGSPEKCDLLADQHKISSERIFNSRDGTAAQSIMEATGGGGIDVILCTSAGEQMHELWRCIAPLGRFIEVGRTDVLGKGRLALEVFERNATFSSFDLGLLSQQKPELVASLMAEVAGSCARGTIKPIDHITRFNIAKLEEAMMFMGQGSHAGKVVITYTDKDTDVGVRASPPRPKFNPDAAYLLVGCQGGIGEAISKWMADRGARHLIFLSRRGENGSKPSATLEGLQLRGVFINVEACDVCIEEDVEVIVKRYAAIRPIRGVIHAAMVLEDVLFEKMTFTQLQSVLGPKVHGTINLHKATLTQPLDFFLTTSSIVTLVGTATQSAYTAANSFQDSFANYRHSQGLPATSLALGMISDAGFASKRPEIQRALTRNGVYGTDVQELVKLLDVVLGSDELVGNSSPHVLCGLEPAKIYDLDKENLGTEFLWSTDPRFAHVMQQIEDHHLTTLEGGGSPRMAQALDGSSTEQQLLALASKSPKAPRLELIELATKAVVERLAKLLFAPVDQVPENEDLRSFGIDSMMSTELGSWLSRSFGLNMSFIELIRKGVSAEMIGSLVVDVLVGRE